MTQIAIVLYRDSPRWTSSVPYEVLRNLPDTEVRFVWHEPGPIAADSGCCSSGHPPFDETPLPDIVLVPGGMSTFEHAQDQKVLDWVRRAHETATWTTSVLGIVDPGRRRVLTGKRATSHWMVVPMLRTFGVTPVSDERIVREGQVVTAAGSRPVSTSGCGWPASSAATPAPRPSSWSSSTTRTRRSTPGTCPRPGGHSGHRHRAAVRETITGHQLTHIRRGCWSAAIQTARDKRKRVA